MPDLAALSIAAAADECPNAHALQFQGQSYTFAELAAETEAQAREGLCPLSASNSLQTLFRLYAFLQEGQDLCLVEPGLPEAEQQRRGALLNEKKRGDELIIFTSGSSGLAKGVRLGRPALLASALACNARLGWAPHSRWLNCLPLNHIGGLAVVIRCLVARKTCILTQGFSVPAIIEAAERDSFTHISLVPTMLFRLLEANWRAQPSLHLVLLGGAPLSPSLRARALEAGLPVVESYGSTESGSMVVADGRPLEGVQLCIDDEALHIKSPTLMSGYLSPETAPVGDTWLRTGDRARMQDERLEILGRCDDMIISGGENVDPREVEAALELQEGVRASYVLGLPDPEWGQILVALVVLGPGVDPAKISAGLQDHRKPKVIISLATLPHLGNGKVDRAQARNIAREFISKK